MTPTRIEYEPLPQRPASPAHAIDLLDDEGPLLVAEDEGDVVPPNGVKMIIPTQLGWINFVLGAAILLPWNAVITAMPYFLSRLSGFALQPVFSSYLPATFTLTGFCFLAYITATSKQSNFSQLIRRSLLVLTLLLSLLTASTFVHLPANLFFFLILLNGVCQSVAGAYLQSAVVAVASLFGPSAIQSVMSGQAAVGVMVSLVQVASAATGLRAGTLSGGTGDRDPAARAAAIFFGCSTLFLVFAITSHACLISSPAYKATVQHSEVRKSFIGQDQEEPEALRHDQRSQDHWVSKQGRILEVAKLNGRLNFAIAYDFIVTLSVFPPITTSIRSVHPPSTSPFVHPLLFTALHFLTFNTGDLVGRSLPALPGFQVWSSKRILFMSLARTLFIPLFLLCNVQRSSTPWSPTPVPIINSDALFFLMMLFFGVTNGWVCSLVMMAAPSTEHNPRLQHRPEDIDTAAIIAQFCLVGGLAIGSFMSFGVKGVICACNPFTT